MQREFSSEHYDGLASSKGSRSLKAGLPWVSLNWMLPNVLLQLKY